MGATQSILNPITKNKKMLHLNIQIENIDCQENISFSCLKFLPSIHCLVRGEAKYPSNSRHLITSAERVPGARIILTDLRTFTHSNCFPSSKLPASSKSRTVSGYEPESESKACSRSRRVAGANPQKS